MPPRSLLLLLLLLLLLAAAGGARGDAWAGVDAVLARAIANGSFPGCVALVATRGAGVAYRRALGTLAYGATPAPCSPAFAPMAAGATRFDIASLTKVVGATTAAMALLQRGALALDTRVAAVRRLFFFPSTAYS